MATIITGYDRTRTSHAFDLIQIYLYLRLDFLYPTVFQIFPVVDPTCCPLAPKLGDLDVPPFLLPIGLRWPFGSRATVDCAIYEAVAHTELRGPRRGQFHLLLVLTCVFALRFERQHLIRRQCPCGLLTTLALVVYSRCQSVKIWLRRLAAVPM
jgi:hypothetical protein